MNAVWNKKCGGAEIGGCTCSRSCEIVPKEHLYGKVERGREVAAAAVEGEGEERSGGKGGVP